MSDSDKPVSMEDLRKALEERPVYLGKYSKLRENQGLEESRCLFMDDTERWYRHLKELFSVFQQDYDKMKKNWAKDRDAMFDYLTEAEELKRELKSIKTNNVVVSRKRVSELLAKAPYYEQLDNIGGMESYAVQMWGSDVEKWVAEVKELLEAGLEKSPHEKETGK